MKLIFKRKRKGIRDMKEDLDLTSDIVFITVKSDLEKQKENLDKDPTDIKRADIEKFTLICNLYEERDPESYEEIKPLCKFIENL